MAYQFDIYSSDRLVGSVGVEDGKLVFAGNVDFLEKLCAEIGGKPEAILSELPKRFTGQGLYTRPHGDSHIIENL